MTVLDAMLGIVGRKTFWRNSNLSKKWRGLALRQREKDEEEVTNLRNTWEVELAEYGAWCCEKRFRDNSKISALNGYMAMPLTKIGNAKKLVCGESPYYTNNGS